MLCGLWLTVDAASSIGAYARMCIVIFTIGYRSKGVCARAPAPGGATGQIYSKAEQENHRAEPAPINNSEIQLSTCEKKKRRARFPHGFPPARPALLSIIYCVL